MMDEHYHHHVRIKFSYRLLGRKLIRLSYHEFRENIANISLHFLHSEN